MWSESSSLFTMIISHRGNLQGPQPWLENKPEYVESAHTAIGEVEIDVWWHEGAFWLGHDAPQFPIKLSWLSQPWLWCHAKNTDAMERLLAHNLHCFWHQDDLLTITSKGIPWCRPGVYLPGGVTVLDSHDFPKRNVLGYCSDYAARFQ